MYEARRYRVYRIDLRTWEPGTLCGDGLEYRFLGPDESDLITQVETLEDWLQGSIERRLRDGALCLVALEGRRVAGFNLVSFGRIWVPLIHTERSFRPDAAWSEQITVSADYRGRGIATELRFRIFADLKARGITRFYGGTLAVNTASLKLARKVGFDEIVEVRYRRVLNSRTWRYIRLRP